jgi:UDP-N-acetylmuramoylalanine--D-glutamate ligase
VSRESAWRLTRISVISAVAGGVFVEDGQLIDDTGRSANKVMDLREVRRLRGRHNWQNAVAAYAATRALGLARADIVAGIAGFPGLPHRQEQVATVDGIRFVNDSKATNAEAAGKALAAYDQERLYWIAGGVPKTGGIAELRDFFPHICRTFLIGEAAPAFAATLGHEAPHEIAGSLDRAVAGAFAAAKEAGGNAVVLLSPACASFDQFTDFEARGEAFRALVQALPGARS